MQPFQGHAHEHISLSAEKAAERRDKDAFVRKWHHATEDALESLAKFVDKVAPDLGRKEINALIDANELSLVEYENTLFGDDAFVEYALRNNAFVDYAIRNFAITERYDDLLKKMIDVIGSAPLLQ